MGPPDRNEILWRHDLCKTVIVLALLHVLKCQNPDVVLLTETRLDTCPAICLRSQMKIDSKVFPHSEGRRGGLASSRHKVVNLSLLFLGVTYIDVIITEGCTNNYRFTGLYVKFRWEDKFKTW